MKREIVCPPCAVKLRKMFPTEMPYPGEHVKFIDGEAREVFICDNCGAGIQEGSDCTAFTIFTDRDTLEVNWESNYLILKDKEINYE